MKRLLCALALLCLAPLAHAQVVTCSDTTLSGKPVPASAPATTLAMCATANQGSATTVTTQVVLWCSGGGTPATAIGSCTAAQWEPVSWMASYSWTWTLQGWQRWGSMVFTPPPAPTPPPTPTPPVVTPPTSAVPGQITVTWVPATTNTSGQADPAAGFVVHWGTASGTYTSSAQAAATATSYVITGLPAGTYYGAVTQTDASGAVSALSSPEWVIQVSAVPTPPTPAQTWKTAAGELVYEAVLPPSGTALQRGNVEGLIIAGVACSSAEAYNLAGASYHDVPEASASLTSPTYQGREHTAVCTLQ